MATSRAVGLASRAAMPRINNSSLTPDEEPVGDGQLLEVRRRHHLGDELTAGAIVGLASPVPEGQPRPARSHQRPDQPTDP